MTMTFFTYHQKEPSSIEREDLIKFAERQLFESCARYPEKIESVWNPHNIKIETIENRVDGITNAKKMGAYIKLLYDHGDDKRYYNQSFELHLADVILSNQNDQFL